MVGSDNKMYEKVFDEWNEVSIDEERKLLIFVILRYYEMLGKKPIKPLKQLISLNKEKLVTICNMLEKRVG